MVRVEGVEEFLALPGATFDVRSPSEYQHAPLPGALSLPLFSDEERAQVGTCYKQVCRDAAVELGLRLAGPRFADMVQFARANSQGQPVKIYCWRGGMRSGAVAWLLETAGMPAITLKGGYKAYRNRCLQTIDNIDNNTPILLLAGMTGAGKTEYLQQLIRQGEQVLDLEAIANHRGSSFGMIDMPPQPSNEHFENEIGRIWSGFDLARPIWIEDESRQIGRLRIPKKLFTAMMQAPIHLLEKTLDERVERLLTIYGKAESDDLIAATMRLKRHLGSERTLEAVQALREGRLTDCIKHVLTYYDAAYNHGLTKRGCFVTKSKEKEGWFNTSPCD
ncbi:MAG: tRNA 2-selenouridine(34) synthase MnmH [Chlamydiales bacterium]|nr:tRNA 2-selenouridine(34) synthase MnmH [Chlamydiales bacterium]